MYTRQATIVILFLALIITGPTTACDAKGSIAHADDSAATEEGVRALVEANNRFAIRMYKDLSSIDTSANVFFSPYSVFSAFGMVYEGAQGQTADEIEQVFGYSQDARERNPAFASIYNRLNPESGKYQLATANALWIDKAFDILDEYVETVTRYFAGEARNVDFQTATEDARQTINKWVESKTNEKIKNLIPPGGLTNDSRLVITNAVYFKGEWSEKFDRNMTSDAEFFTASGQSVQAPMMRLPNGYSQFGYTEDDGVQLLRMPYVGDGVSMVVALPRKGELEALEKNLSAQRYEQWMRGWSPKDVAVHFPKFKMALDYSLRSVLDGMGMPTAFTEQADFSGISQPSSLLIQAVFHKAFVDVFEEGTEAAAATGVVMGVTSIPNYTVFRADHPFLFFIIEDKTGAILFMGRVANPAG